MATPTQIRRLAFQTLFQLDARGGGAEEEIRLTLGGAGEFTPGERERAFTLAREAYAGRARADADFLELAPTWPAHRQPAPDRAILRLAHYEIVSGRTPVPVAIDEAVELAKEFGGEKSPGFVNGLLDGVRRKHLAGGAGGAASPGGAA